MLMSLPLPRGRKYIDLQQYPRWANALLPEQKPPGTLIENPENGLFQHRIVQYVYQPCDPDDWFSECDRVPIGVYVDYPWRWDTINTSQGPMVIEWLEDEMLPRTAMIVDAGNGPYFRAGDIVRTG